MKHGEALAIVLARAGSKGVPGKNRAPVAGQPCVCWTFDHLRSSRLVTRGGVSTDDPQIARLALAAGLEHWPRPAELAHDRARVVDAARSALACANERAPVSPDAAVVLLYANVPVRPAGLIDRAIALLWETGCDSVQSYARVGKQHPAWLVRLDEDGKARPWQGQRLFSGIDRRQDLEPAFVPDGGVLVVRRRILEDASADANGPHAFLGQDHRGITTEPGEVIDIDSPVDLAVAHHVLTMARAAPHEVDTGSAKAGQPTAGAPEPAG